jgi:hypothetical protein
MLNIFNKHEASRGQSLLYGKHGEENSAKREPSYTIGTQKPRPFYIRQQNIVLTSKAYAEPFLKMYFPYHPYSIFYHVVDVLIYCYKGYEQG